ncbi:MAG: GDP-L-fucose synthase [Acidobacteriota bacterium]|nr:GDP-L-fucose synthase [Acidobacteriota bacterium]
MSNFIPQDAKIFVAGHRGLAGGAITRRLQAQGYQNLLLRTRQQVDLLDREAVRAFFAAEKPEYVFLAAAKVGGILANRDFPAEFIAQNLRIQSNVIEAARDFGVKRLLFLGSSCIYPKLAPQPITEEQLLAGPLEFTNRSYAVAKIAGIEMCWAFNRQYGTSFLAAMPTNLYGPGDSYDLHNSHVLPALIRKVDQARRDGASKLVVWGTGTPLREFLYSEDMADACIYLLNLPEEEFRKLTAEAERAPLVNVGSGTDLSIGELARTVCNVLDFSGTLEFDTSKPDGTPRKLMDSSRLFSFGWRPRVSLEEGIRLAYEDFRTRREAGAI